MLSSPRSHLALSAFGVAEELASEHLRRGRHLRIRARGGSMVPFLLDGDVVLVKPAAAQEIAAGDVICYEASPGRLLLHRVIGRHGAAWITKGDALAFTDVVDSRHLLGKVVARERRGRALRLDTRVARWSSHLIARVSPAVSALVPLALRVRRRWRAVVRA